MLKMAGLHYHFIYWDNSEKGLIQYKSLEHNTKNEQDVKSYISEKWVLNI